VSLNIGIHPIPHPGEPNYHPPIRARTRPALALGSGICGGPLDPFLYIESMSFHRIDEFLMKFPVSCRIVHFRPKSKKLIYLDSGDFSDNCMLKPHLVIQKTKKIIILYAFLIVFAAKHFIFGQIVKFDSNEIFRQLLIYIFRK